mgnify:CR=1 FL=1
MGRPIRDDNLTRLEKLKFRMQVVEILRLLKARYKYSQFSKLTNLQATVLSRYILGHVLPSFERAVELWHVLKKVVNIRDEIMERIRFDGNGFFDNTAIIYDPLIRTFVTTWIYEKLMGTRVNKVLTVAVDGIPIATTLSDRLGVPLVVAKKEKEIGVPDFWTVDLIRGSGHRETLYVPKSSLTKKDWVVIVDDVIRTGETQRALIELVRKVGAKLSGLFILISVGDWRGKIDAPDDCPVEVLVTLKEGVGAQDFGRKIEERGMARRRPGRLRSNKASRRRSVD